MVSVCCCCLQISTFILYTSHIFTIIIPPHSHACIHTYIHTHAHTHALAQSLQSRKEKFHSQTPPPNTHTYIGQYPGMYQQPPAPTSSVPTSYHNPHSPAGIVTAAGVGTAAVVSAEEERRHFEESKRIERQSLESAVEDKIRRQVKQVLDTAQVSWMYQPLPLVYHGVLLCLQRGSWD